MSLLKNEIIDHSKTYSKISVRNLPHLWRLKKIEHIISSSVGVSVKTYADFGCSNGFITNRIMAITGAKKGYGFDRSDNLAIARKSYPHIEFEFRDLNQLPHRENYRVYDLVTCFETLEHVGNLQNALDSVMRSRKERGYALITVPIETGIIGVVKLLAKQLIYRERFPLDCGFWRYLLDLVSGTRLSSHREDAEAYGPHYGFDHRDIDEMLATRSGFDCQAMNSFTTRCYLIKPVEQG